MSNSRAKSIIGTISSYTWVFAAIIVAGLFYGTIYVGVTFAMTTKTRIPKIVWLADALTAVLVNEVICVRTARIRFAKNFRFTVFLI